MTARGAYESLLIELSKESAPSILLADFNYYLNKAIQQYINKRYNIYSINQQTTDDLRVLQAQATINMILVPDAVFEATYNAALPSDYWHLLNCICIYKVKKDYKCFKEGAIVRYPAKKLTEDAWPIIIQDYYNRPLPERPYYFLNNTNTSNIVPTNPSVITGSAATIGGTDMNGTYSETNSNLSRTIRFTNISNVKKQTAVRYGNASDVIIEIRYGDDSVFELQKIVVNYLKTPQYINLTQDQLDLIEDTSQIMEFPDYVCNEILNELVILVMANTADPRIQTTPIVTQSIASPIQQQTPQS